MPGLLLHLTYGKMIYDRIGKNLNIDKYIELRYIINIDISNYDISKWDTGKRELYGRTY